MNKLKMWQPTQQPSDQPTLPHTSWEEFEQNWDEGAKIAAEKTPIQGLKQLPKMPGMTAETAKHLKWKSLKWIICKDTDFKIIKSFLRHPLRYGWALLRSMIKKRSFLRDEDFFFYGLKNVDEFLRLIDDPKSLLVVGFSYCHKPFECPSGRFTDACIHDPNNPICRQCFIGKSVNALPENSCEILFIPTIHYVSGKILDLIHQNPDKTIAFLITACEMTLEMFADLGNMANIKGIGVRLDGRICNTMKAFELSEQGIKPGLTVVLEPTQQRIFNLIRHYRQQKQKG